MFNTTLRQYSDETLFDGFELKTTKPLKEVQAGILSGLRNQTALKIVSDETPAPEIFAIQASQEFQTVLATSSGRRNAIIIGARTKDDETQILYKVLEYKTEAQIKFSIGNLIGAPVAVNYVPLHSSRI